MVSSDLSKHTKKKQGDEGGEADFSGGLNEESEMIQVVHKDDIDIVCTLSMMKRDAAEGWKAGQEGGDEVEASGNSKHSTLMD